MRRMRTLVVVVVVAMVGLTGCRKRIAVANTPEGKECQRQCMLIFNTCMGGRGGGKHVCRERENECLETCPRPGEAAAISAAEKVVVPAPVATASSVEPAPAVTAAPKKCVASDLPEWQGASAAEKKALLERCK